MPPSRTLGSVLLLFLFFSVSLSQQEANPTLPWRGEPGISLTVEQIMAQEAARGSEPVWRIGRKPPRIRPDRGSLPQNPESKETPQWPAAGSSESRLPTEAPQTLGVSFTGATLAGTNPTFSFPPDVMGDVGPTQYIVAVNGRIVSFNKTTGVADGVLNADMDVFFNSVRNGQGTSDPRIRYDRLSGRWFIIIINVAATNNRVLFAVSNTSTITGGTVWTYFFFQQNTVAPAGNNTQFADYPTLGVDANALYIGCNMFTSGGSFSNVSAWVVRKSSIIGAGPIVATAFRDLLVSNVGPYTPQGVDNFDPAATQGYFIGVDNATFGTLMIRRVSDPGGTPTISSNISLTVSSTQFPVKVPHLGNTGGNNGRLDALDDRLYQAVMRNGRLWTAHNIGVTNTGSTTSPNRNAARWYEIQNLSGTPSVFQSGTLYDPSTPNDVTRRNYWIPSVMVSGQGHAALGFSVAGTSERINAGTAGRLSGDALGTLQTAALYTSSSTAYNPSSDPGGSGGRRWGDYSYTSVDPNDDMTMWTIQQFCDATNSYGVRVVQLIAPPPATPVSANPATIAAGLSSVSVTITGSQISGSGFFDPGAGFLNRIGASVTGGVTVNSVTYVSPTSVTLNLSTVGATAGAKNVTVTNPDAQARTGNSILTVGGGAGSLIVTAPNGGESWPIGSSRTITWTSQNLTGNVKIDLSTNGGSTFSTIFASTANDGTEAWTVSGPATATARIRISSLDSLNVADTSNANFSMILPTITVSSPNGGETWGIGSSQSIQWGSANLTGNVTITLSRDGGTTYPETLATNTANDGTEGWTVSGPPTSQGRVRVASVSVAGVADESNAHFSIVTPTITVTSPNGGEDLAIGSSHSILWSSSNLVGNVTVLLSRNGGVSYPETLFTNTPNDGIQAWSVTGPVTAQAHVRIVSVLVSGVEDVSDGVSSIVQPTLTVTAPNGGETLAIGSSFDLTWISSYVTGNVRILLSRNGGATFPETLFVSTPNDSIQSWNVSGPPAANARIRISSITLAGVADTSDANFSIIQPAITVSSPNGGEEWVVDSVYQILWNSMNVTGNVHILLSRDGGVTYPETLFVGTTDDGTEDWTATGPNTSAARVRVVSVVFPTATDVSDANFTIATPSIQVVSPNGGESVPVDSTILIQWNSFLLSGPVHIELSRNGGSTYETLFGSTTNDGSEPWVVAGPTTTQAKMRISGVSSPGILDASDGLFTINRRASVSAGPGWSMLSLPLTVSDQKPSSVFPTATSSAFTFTPSGYTPQDTLRYGKGYWLKFGTSQSVGVTGQERHQDSISVVAGWNMIGSISRPVPVDSIVQIPPGIVLSSYFGPPGYSATDTIQVMRAYWVKVSQPGTLVLPPLSGPVPSWIRSRNNGGAE